MTHKIPTRISIIILLFCTAFPALAQKKWPGIVLYSIAQNTFSKNLTVDPIVRIDKGKYSFPVPTPKEAFEGPNSHQVLEGLFDRFCREEYTKGRQLQLYVDGNKCGMVNIQELDTVNSCSPVVSEVNISPDDSTALGFAGHGLVIASANPKKPIPKFPLDSLLQASILEYGKNEFIKRGVKKDVAKEAYFLGLSATDLDGDGKPEYLASYFIIGEEAEHGETNMEYALTMILEPDAGGFKQLYTHYSDPGIPQELNYYKFVDVLDFDGEGICKVIVQKRFYSAWDYLLIQRENGEWKEVYEGAGSGC